jgi:hypothetical protein
MVDPYSEIVFSNFTEDSVICTDQDIVYSILVNPPTSLVNFTKANNTIFWFTELDSDIKVYEITIFG